MLLLGPVMLREEPSPGENGNEPGDRGGGENNGEGDQGGSQLKRDVGAKGRGGGGLVRRGGRGCPCDDVMPIGR